MYVEDAATQLYESSAVRLKEHGITTPEWHELLPQERENYRLLAIGIQEAADRGIYE